MSAQRPLVATAGTAVPSPGPARLACLPHPASRLPGDTEPSYPRGWSRPGSPAAAAAARPRLASSPALTSVSPPLPTEDFEGENPQVPKLEKSISGTSPKRERLPLAVGIAFFLLTFWAS